MTTYDIPTILKNNLRHVIGFGASVALRKISERQLLCDVVRCSSMQLDAARCSSNCRSRTENGINHAWRGQLLSIVKSGIFPTLRKTLMNDPSAQIELLFKLCSILIGINFGVVIGGMIFAWVAE